jgi:hypothetical protein
MSSFTHKYNTRLTSGAIKKPKYSNTIFENNDDDNEDEDPDYEEDKYEEEDEDEDEEYEEDEEDEDDDEEDEDDDEEDEDDDEEDEDEDEEDEEYTKSKFDKVEYYKLLNSLYPSKYSAAKVNNELVKNKTTNLFKNFILRNAMFLKPEAKLLKTIAKNNLHKRFKDKKTSGKNVIIINIKNSDGEHDEEYDEEQGEEYDEEQGEYDEEYDEKQSIEEEYEDKDEEEKKSESKKK